MPLFLLLLLLQLGPYLVSAGLGSNEDNGRSGGESSSRAPRLPIKPLDLQTPTRVTEELEKGKTNYCAILLYNFVKVKVKVDI